MRKKLSLFLLGGINTGFLFNNEVYSSSDKSNKVGETDDISTLIFKSVIGISLEHPLTRKLYLSFSPTYKYQLNKFNKASIGSSRLQFFDITTAISYHF